MNKKYMDDTIHQVKHVGMDENNHFNSMTMFDMNWF